MIDIRGLNLTLKISTDTGYIYYIYIYYVCNMYVICM